MTLEGEEVAAERSAFCDCRDAEQSRRSGTDGDGIGRSHAHGRARPEREEKDRREEQTLPDGDMRPAIRRPGTAHWLNGRRDGSTPPTATTRGVYDPAMKIAWSGNAVEIRELGSGPAVVLLHGYPLDGAMWSGVARLLSERFRVLKPDLPGRGATPPAPAGGIDAYADFVEAILAELPSVGGVAGFSMGGYVALALARRRPPNLGALALVDTRAGADTDAGRAARDEAIVVAREKGVEAIAETMLGKLLSAAALANRDTVERVRRIMLRQPSETVAADLAAMRDRRDSTAFLGEIRVPTRILVGAEDAISPPDESRAMADAIPGADCVVIPGAGHLTPVERPRAVATALDEFFGKTLSASEASKPAD